jgi:hypothetical protein
MYIKFIFAVILPVFVTRAFSQSDQEVQSLILHKDSIFWKAYNNCDVDVMASFIAEDVEFYHDLGGAQKTRDTMMAITKKNLCSRPDFRLRREAVPGTIKVFPMKKNGKPYGAIISGEHLFYINQAGKEEFLDGHASFSHLWIVQDGKWAMSRIFSYDHHAAKQTTAK